MMKREFSGFLDASINRMVTDVQASLTIVQAQHIGHGAGVIWREDGLILTNGHVLGRRPNRTPLITLADDRQFEARVLALAPEVDLALLSVQSEDLPAAKLGNSTQMRIGELAFAIGHPWGQRASVTAGIISHLTTAQTSGKRGVVPIIRTDAVLAPGNSGGPLVNASGEVVGINTMVVGGDQGVAIPSAVADDFVASALRKGDRYVGQRKEKEQWGFLM